MAFFTGLFNSLTSIVARLVVAAIVGVIIWFAFDFFVDVPLNALAHIGEDGPRPNRFSAHDPVFFYVKIGLILVSTWLLVVKSSPNKS